MTGGQRRALGSVGAILGFGLLLGGWAWGEQSSQRSDVGPNMRDLTPAVDDSHCDSRYRDELTLKAERRYADAKVVRLVCDDSYAFVSVRVDASVRGVEYIRVNGEWVEHDRRP